MYERSFPAIGERFFKKTAWPTPDAIATHAENDPVFKMLYAELYYRHLHQAIQLDLAALNFPGCRCSRSRTSRCSPNG